MDFTFNLQTLVGLDISLCLVSNANDLKHLNCLGLQITFGWLSLLLLGLGGVSRKKAKRTKKKREEEKGNLNDVRFPFFAFLTHFVAF